MDKKFRVTGIRSSTKEPFEDFFDVSADFIAKAGGVEEVMKNIRTNLGWTTSDIQIEVIAPQPDERDTLIADLLAALFRSQAPIGMHGDGYTITDEHGELFCNTKEIFDANELLIARAEAHTKRVLETAK